MTKVLIGFAILLAAVSWFWVVGRLTGVFEFYRTPSVSNAPTFQLGSLFLTSKHATPKRLDFIAYYPPLPELSHTVYFHRLCGLPGDTLEIRRGRLFVNRHDQDAGLTLAHFYTLARPDFSRLPQGLLADAHTTDDGAADSLRRVDLADAEVAARHLRAVRQLLLPTYCDAAIQQRYKQCWNQDNFGPVVVPADCYFVLGDNRLDAEDSRYTGWLPKANFLGTVLGH